MKTENKAAAKPAANPMLQSFRNARNAAAPLVAIQTPDQSATINAISVSMNGTKPPMFTWDIVRGVRAVDKESAAHLGKFGDCASLINPAETLVAANGMPEDAILFMLNAQRQINAADVVQAASNLRDVFKANGRTLVLMGPMIKLPSELESDVLLLDEPLPEGDQLKEIAKSVYHAGDQKEPTDEALTKIVDATAGLAAFPAEQAVAMSLRKSGMDLPTLWERKRQMVEQTPGLAVYRGKDNFDDIGGLENLKQFSKRIIKGKRAPRVIIFVDEIEKSINPEGDLSGVSKDQLGAKLTFMQDNNAAGMILIGPPGTCKSAFAKSFGNEADCPTVILDLGGMKAGIVGESENNIRTALKVCKAIGGDRMLFVATCNSIGALPPELRRRYTLGTFFMDLPDADERAAIWALYIKKYFPDGLKDSGIPNDEGWTGAEIRQCVDLAFSLGIPLTEAAQYIVPVAQSASEQIAKLREQAHRRYISAGKPGLYQKPTGSAEPSAPAPMDGKRKMTLRD